MTARLKEGFVMERVGDRIIGGLVLVWWTLFGWLALISVVGSRI